ncbi:MAG: CbtA family protein [Methylococcales bacterium]|nr:CbtA family protein [Methylococcales bacterium]MDD5630833.1 CbtA family protein [Methylococcales bacterium]
MTVVIPPVFLAIDMFNLSHFRMILIPALWSGLWAGMLLTVVQSIQVIPTLLQAEVYEEQAAAISVHSHSSSKGAQTHQHEAESWQPQNGWERTAYTAAANISLAVGFALLLGAASNLRGGIGHWRNGLLWGLAGYTIFFVAPSLGLPPEVPGTEAANLKDRQLWWLMAVIDTAIGLWLLFFSKTRLNKLLGSLLLISPHLIGAPQPDVHGSAAPAELANTFIVATATANAVFWLALGSLMGLFSRKNQVIKK